MRGFVSIIWLSFYDDKEREREREHKGNVEPKRNTVNGRSKENLTHVNRNWAIHQTHENRHDPWRALRREIGEDNRKYY